ncbi:MAG: GNAT family N-acetyltransferase [Treponema sp.]|nr:GNAT family N-acetyltransferase [Treponema sp.]
MSFDLDKLLINEILFFMENQDGEFSLDTVKRKIIDTRKEPPINDNSGNLLKDENRFISLPEWDSNDGYRLMEKFAHDQKSPLIREELSDALNKKKGVFRAYRNVLSRYPEAEKKWLSYKECEMKNEIIAWYNVLREEWGLEPVGSEPEDNLSLILEDFIIRKRTDEYTFTAETANGDNAGYVNANLFEVNQKKSLYINCIEVDPAYRGMGIGKALLSKTLEIADKEKLDVFIDLPSGMEFFSRSLHLENFEPVSRKFVRKREK